MRKFFGGFFRNSAKKMVKPNPSMPVNAGKRLAGGMTSPSKMPTQTFATREQARQNYQKKQKMKSLFQNKLRSNPLSNKLRTSREIRQEGNKFGSKNTQRDAVIMQQKKQRMAQKMNANSSVVNASPLTGRRTRKRSSANLNSFLKLTNFAIFN